MLLWFKRVYLDKKMQPLPNQVLYNEPTKCSKFIARRNGEKYGFRRPTAAREFVGHEEVMQMIDSGLLHYTRIAYEERHHFALALAFPATVR